ncbi:MAG TPA: phenylalanine--tRNA ligase subunit beta, partial [Polyangia bacterium]|nr:phenylalanine--tRNA ligase subunit beta [Polyangia bacterium]
MKISFNWLRELVDLKPGVTADSVSEKLSLAGLEVESIERRGRDLSGVVIAEVRGKRPHPGADSLSVVRVTSGAGEEEVVCGAPNVPAPGGKVAWAPPGAMLPGGRTLDRREIRGVSSPGMLCSEVELGIGEGADGILILPPDAPVGADLARHIGLLDEVLEVNVTPNRPDALSHAGIAREVAALFETTWRLPALDDLRGTLGGFPAPPATTPLGEAELRQREVAHIPLPQGRGIDVDIKDATACPRYAARFVLNLKVGPSPLPMRVRLAACGVRAISNLVDVTNYVMLETGHPLHAFDLDRLRGAVQVRRAGRAEKMKTLDGIERPLQESDIVIADGSGPIALAGVMGGADSEVHAGTTSVLLEAATFDPRAIRRTSKRLGLRSEASHRFERGVDPNGVPYASKRAAALLARLGGGAVAGEGIDRYPQQQHPRPVTLSAGGLARLAGFEIPLETAAAKLSAIGIATNPEGNDKLVATVPTFRPDISIEEDLVEEVMRLVGYDRAPVRLPHGSGAPAPSPETTADRARDVLAALGLAEIVSWGFVPRPWLAALGAPLDDGVAVKNPISTDYEVMRTSLLPGLVDAARRNLARSVPDVGLFEVGPVVRRAADPKEAPVETTYAAAILLGRRPDWLKRTEPLDFFDLKETATELLRALGAADARFHPAAERGLLHPGVGAEIRLGGAADAPVIGRAGEIHPRLRKTLGLEEPAFYLEIALDGALGARGAVRSSPPPRFPASTRDISFWIDVAVTADAQRALLASGDEPLLRELAVLEDYRDPRYAPAGQKGMLWTLTHRADDRTLTDAEVDAAHARVVERLKSAP